MSILDALRPLGRRPGAVPAPPPATEPRPARKVSACDLAYAAREAVAQVLPTEWHTLPGGGNTATILAGTIANYYAERTTQPEPDLHYPDPNETENQ